MSWRLSLLVLEAGCVLGRVSKRGRLALNKGLFRFIPSVIVSNTDLLLLVVLYLNKILCSLILLLYVGFHSLGPNFGYAHASHIIESGLP